MGIEQGFKRIVVEESLHYGEENEDYLLREDARLRKQGLKGIKKERKGASRADESVPSIPETLQSAADDADVGDNVTTTVRL